ncbi:MAG: hypothetical protein QG563_116 [Patescibacteria group bacterium]|jgi:prepilin-type N-terminal cleavage/methylation domain-containing protein|nr:hypothetical protein [Patescibacteria group bacterium]
MTTQTNNKIRTRGFTLVETLVSLAIFASAIVGMIVITSQGINDTNYSKNKLVATALSQEGIEMVRNIRDSALLGDTSGTGQGWDDFLGLIADCTGGNMCSIDPLYPDTTGLSITQCGSDSDCVLYRDAQNPPSYFQSEDSTAGDSSYIRTIQINELEDPATNEITSVEIVSTVKWTQGSGGQKEVVSKEYLTNWFVNSVTP